MFKYRFISGENNLNMCLLRFLGWDLICHLQELKTGYISNVLLNENGEVQLPR